MDTRHGALPAISLKKGPGTAAKAGGELAAWPAQANGLAVAMSYHVIRNQRILLSHYG